MSLICLITPILDRNIVDVPLIFKSQTAFKNSMIFRGVPSFIPIALKKKRNVFKNYVPFVETEM